MSPAENITPAETHRGWKWVVTFVYGIPLLFALPFFYGSFFIIVGLFTEPLSSARLINDVFLLLWSFAAPIILATSIVLVWRRSLKWALLVLPLSILLFATLAQIRHTQELLKLEAQKNRMGDLMSTEKEETFVGEIEMRAYYGPPNYGENPDTDAKEEVPILRLAVPTNITGINGAIVEIAEMQLDFSRSTIHMSESQGFQLVKGVLRRAETGHHHTPVILEVRSIRASVAN